MKRVEVISQEGVKVSPFILSEFTPLPHTSEKYKKVTKKALKSIAKELGIKYDESHLEFAKKTINVYLERMK